MDKENGDATPPFPAARPTRSQSAPSSKSRPSPVLREDCWSEEETQALIEAWGSRHLALNRGNLRQHHWKEVAAAVNAAVSGRRTDVQCKNRIDTLKKKYKIEKARTADSAGAYVSPWPFFCRLDFLIAGDCSSKPSPSPAPALTNFPVGPRSATQKRPAPVDESYFRRNFAAAAAASADSSEEKDSSEGTSREREEEGFESGCRQLADAIRRFGEVYERVEAMKQEQLIELEKHRMQFAKDLEYQRMKLLMDTQLQLARIKRSKHSDDAGQISFLLNFIILGSLFSLYSVVK